MYTLKEVASIFKCHVETLKRMIQRGEINAVKFGREWRITEEEVERLKRGE